MSVFSFHSCVRGANRKWKERVAFCVAERCLGAPRASVNRQELERGPLVFIKNRRPAKTAVQIALSPGGRSIRGREAEL